MYRQREHDARVSGLKTCVPSAAQVDYEPLADADRLPTTVSWRGTQADGIVKDQASCGSCWAFGMTGAIHAAHFMTTGAALLAAGALRLCRPQGQQVR